MILYTTDFLLIYIVILLRQQQLHRNNKHFIFYDFDYEIKEVIRYF